MTKCGIEHLQIVCVLFGLLACCKKEKAPVRTEQVAESIQRDSLRSWILAKRTETGRFPSISCSNLEMTLGCGDEDTLFDSYLIYGNLYFAKDAPTSDVGFARFRNLVKSEMWEPNLWKFGMRKSDRHKELPADLDDSSNAILVLGIPKELDYTIIEENRNAEGLFNTWVPDTGDRNKIDCSVNLNTLMVLPVNQRNTATFESILSFFESGRLDECNMYYVGPFVPAYFLWRTMSSKYPDFRERVARELGKLLEAEPAPKALHDRAIVMGLRSRIFGSDRASAARTLASAIRAFQDKSENKVSPVYWDVSGKRYFGSEVLSASYAYWALYAER